MTCLECERESYWMRLSSKFEKREGRYFQLRIDVSGSGGKIVVTG